ncbi:MliC family protein [Marivita sp. S0852]|uniref:MliC family protein n=1 Tax=Marivita sp. S0852 TaxID=3373893 RepID=UPI003982BF87
MKNITICAASFLLGAGAAAADVTLSLGIEIDETDSIRSVVYDCDTEDRLSVQYINADANSLALLEIDDDTRVFVNVVSASGARYVSGSYVWWSQGDSATLENTLSEDRIMQCQTQTAASSE